MKERRIDLTSIEESGNKNTLIVGKRPYENNYKELPDSANSPLYYTRATYNRSIYIEGRNKSFSSCLTESVQRK